MYCFSAEFNGYDHCQTNQIHIDDAPNALIDVVPFVSESVARALFSSPDLEQEISFDIWWNEIEKFYKVATHLTAGTQPEKDVGIPLNKNCVV